MQQAVDLGVEGIADLAGDDGFRSRRQQSRAQRFPRLVFFDGRDAVDRIFDRVITGASAEIALEHARKILDVVLVQTRGRHDHAGGTEAALESGSLHERTLHRMKFAIVREALDSGHLVAVGAKGRDEAAMNRRAVEPYGACAAVTGVASFFDSEPSHLAQESTQDTVPGAALRRKFCHLQGSSRRHLL